MTRLFAAMVVLVVVDATSAVMAAPSTAPDARRVEEIAQTLPDKPRGFGPVIGDRDAWKKIAAAPQYKDAVATAEKLMKQPLPELTEELFIDFSLTGNRNRAQKVIAIRQQRYPALVMAECIENKGRFIPAIERAIGAVCSDKTWVLPAHDWGLKNFKGIEIDIDLRSSNQALNLATAYYWLGDRLSEEVRKVMRDKIRQQVFEPFEKSINTGKPRLWWLTCTHNWNAVCLAGVTGAALTMIESPQQRAFYVAATEKLSNNFLAGFTPDGYCSEGVGYWNYGFGHFVMLSEMVRRATDGKIDMLENESVRRVARFGHRMEIVKGVYPAFADCSLDAKPDEGLMTLLNRRYGFAAKEKETEPKTLNPSIGPQSWLFSIGLLSFDDPTMKTAGPKPDAAAKQLRDWFQNSGILICRPGGNAVDERGVDRRVAGGFGAALKGGNNAEHHNHNDVGSYLVTLAGKTPLIDPGSEVYTARTFSNRRYESDVLNSFGHPVPCVGGKLQSTGKAAAAKVISTDFTNQRDTLLLDIKSAYDVKEIKKLQRGFTFTRGRSPGLTVVDTFEFDSPTAFETALVTSSPWKQVSPDRLVFGEGDSAVEVRIDTAGADFEIKADKLTADVIGGIVPVRLGISLSKPVTKGKITTTITPAKEN